MNKCRFIQCENSEEAFKNVKYLKALISNHWNSEISSLALKDLNEKHWDKSGMFTLTSEFQQFQTYVMNEDSSTLQEMKSYMFIFEN